MGAYMKFTNICANVGTPLSCSALRGHLKEGRAENEYYLFVYFYYLLKMHVNTALYLQKIVAYNCMITRQICIDLPGCRSQAGSGQLPLRCSNCNFVT